jgi:hypothetical protein
MAALDLAQPEIVNPPSVTAIFGWWRLVHPLQEGCADTSSPGLAPKAVKENASFPVINVRKCSLFALYSPAVSDILEEGIWPQSWSKKLEEVKM